MNIKKELHYLAGPYSHKDKTIMDQREIVHAKVAVALKKEGFAVYAPIPETSALAKLADSTETSWEAWREHDLNLLARCDKLLVILMDGMEQSLGVRGEVKFALLNNIPVEFVTEDGSCIVTADPLNMLGVKKVTDLND